MIGKTVSKQRICNVALHESSRTFVLCRDFTERLILRIALTPLGALLPLIKTKYQQ